MANVAVTCIKNGRSDSFGRPLVSGTYYPSVEIETAKALWNSGYVSVADASVFDQDPLAGTSPLDDFNIARALSLSRQPAQTSANLAAELAAIGSSLTYKFPSLTAGRLLASLVAGSTATRAGLVVTVTATAHGIPPTTFDGCDFFFPGCSSLASGWYKNFLYLTANSLQFALPDGALGVDFTSESINSGNAFIDRVEGCSLTLPGSSLQSGSRLRLSSFRQGSPGAGAKYLFFFTGVSDQQGRSILTTSANGFAAFTAVCDGNKIRGLTNQVDFGLSSVVTDAVTDFNAPLPCRVELQHNTAGEYLYLAYAVIEVLK